MHSHGGATVSAGDHTHTGGTDSQGDHLHSISVAFVAGINGAGGGPGSSMGGGSGINTSVNGAHTHALAINVAGSHSHSISLDGGHQHTAQAVGDHTHAIYGDGSHAHNVWLGGGGVAMSVLNPVLVVTKIIYAGQQAAAVASADTAMSVLADLAATDDLAAIRQELAELRALLAPPARSPRLLSSPSRGPH